MATTNFRTERIAWTLALVFLLVIWTVKLMHPTADTQPQIIVPAAAQKPVVNPSIQKPEIPSEATNIQGGGAHNAASNSTKDVAPAAPYNSMAGGRPLILYAYSETPNARANLIFFLAHALHGSADFVFIMNGESDATELIPKESNIRIVQRENDCYDLGAYAEVLMKDDLYKDYKRFILMNASLRGPFIPAWASGCWSEMYLGKLSDTVKLVGMTGNCQPIFHVQSMIWATDLTGMELLLHPPPDPNLPPDAEQEVGINSCFHTWETAVHAETHATHIIMSAGYKVSVMMAAFSAKDTFIEDCDKGGNGDALWNGKYYGTNVHPFETVFMKSNRDIDPILMDRLTEWTDGNGYSSYDHC